MLALFKILNIKKFLTFFLSANFSKNFDRRTSNS